MPPRVPDRIVPFACGAFALAVATLAACASMIGHGWKASALVHVPTQLPAVARDARKTDPHFVIVKEGWYDGAYYYEIARDPLARHANGWIDRPAYRYGHAGYGELAYLASLGHDGKIPQALLALSLLGMAVAGWAASVLARRLGWTPWAGLGIAFNPGLFVSVTLDTVEAVGAALLLVALLAYLRGRWLALLPLLVVACLVKEPFVLLPAGLAVWEAIRWRREGRPPRPAARFAILAAGPAALAGWMVYIRHQVGAWPLSQSAENLAWPFNGWRHAILDSAGLAFSPTTGADTQLGQVNVTLLATIGAALFVGLVVALRRRTPVDPVFFLWTALIFCTSAETIAFPKDVVRNTAIPLLLLPAVLAGARLSASPPASPTPPERPPGGS